MERKTPKIKLKRNGSTKDKEMEKRTLEYGEKETQQKQTKTKNKTSKPTVLPWPQERTEGPKKERC